jgi:hypothetical protein
MNNIMTMEDLMAMEFVLIKEVASNDGNFIF